MRTCLTLAGICACIAGFAGWHDYVFTAAAVGMLALIWLVAAAICWADRPIEDTEDLY